MAKNKAKRLVMQNCFRQRQEKPKKGMGSYQRNPKHKAPKSGLCSLRSAIFLIDKVKRVCYS